MFTPQCSAGGCVTLLRRQRSDRTYVTTTLKPLSATQYKGVTSYVSACFSSAGAVHTPKGYNATETAVVNVTKSAAGTTTALSGTLRLIEAKTVSIKRTR